MPESLLILHDVSVTDLVQLIMTSLRSGLAERYSLDVLRRHIRSRQEIVSFPSRSPRGSIAQRSAASSTVAVLHHRRGSSAAAAAMSGASGGSTTAATTAPMGNGGVGKSGVGHRKIVARTIGFGQTTHAHSHYYPHDEGCPNPVNKLFGHKWTLLT